MSRRYCKISGVTIVSCDHVRHPNEKPWCPNDFRSASIRSIIPAQLAEAKWTTRAIGRGDVRQIQDLCPDHPARGIMEMAALASGGDSPSGSGSRDSGAGPPASRFL